MKRFALAAFVAFLGLVLALPATARRLRTGEPSPVVIRDQPGIHGRVPVSDEVEVIRQCQIPIELFTDFVQADADPELDEAYGLRFTLYVNGAGKPRTNQPGFEVAECDVLGTALVEDALVDTSQCKVSLIDAFAIDSAQPTYYVVKGFKGRKTITVRPVGIECTAKFYDRARLLGPPG